MGIQASDAVWVTSSVTDDSAVSGVKLTYVTGSGSGSTTTPFTETLGTTAVKPWTGSTGSTNAWTVTGNYFELRTGANYVTSTTDCGLEYKAGTTLNTATGAMVATANSIQAAGTSGTVEFWVQTLTLDATDGWTFQVSPDAGTTWNTRLSELTGSSHAYQKYTYSLASSERVSTLKLRFQFVGGGTGDDDRIDVDQITVSLVTGSLPVEITMVDDGAHGDGASGDHVYGGQIPAMANGTTVSYYVTATDDAGLTASDPATAPTDKYSYIVGHATPTLQLNEFMAASTSFVATTDYPTPTVGLSLNATDAMAGYTLLDPMHGTTTYLIDNTGQVVHTWTSAYEPGRTAYLMPNGHLFRACMAPGQMSTGGGEGGRIEERDWDGNLVWYLDYASTTYMMHHDFKVLPNGNILMLVVEKMLYADVLAAGFNPSLLDSAIATDGYLLPDSVVEVKPTGSAGGTVVWEWHVKDHLIQDYDASKANYGVVAQHPELIDANGPGIKIPEFWNHINGIDYNAALDQVMLSARNQNEVWIIDHSTTTAQAAAHSGGTHGKGGDLLYRWGDPRMYDAGTVSSRMLYEQHNTQWIASDSPGAGNILYFNNGINRPAGTYSTIDEFTPPVDAAGNYTYTTGSAYGPTALTWSYVATPPTSFYSMEISGAQRLQNGNTLICEGLTGRIFEVTSSGQIVWQYQNPVTDTGILNQGSSLPADPRGGYMTATFRALRYPTTYAAFAGRTLTPSGSVEVYPDWIELRNPGTSAVDLSGMYLTNDTSTPTKFQIPTGVSIPAGGYLLFWADNNTTEGSRHTNFTLDPAGGTISLYDIDGITRVDTVTYGAQTTNVSSGRYPNGTGNWQAMTTPTPGTANEGGVNEAPTDITLSSTSVAENLPAGTAVGTLTSADPNSGNTFTYSLVSGAGSDNNGSLTISGNTLQTAVSFDYETQNSYSVRIRSTDQGGLSVEKVFSLSVTNANEPPVILGTSRTPAVPAAADAVWVTSTVTDDGTVSGVKLTYSTGTGTPTTSTVFTETMTSTEIKPWTGTGAVNAWTVTGTYLEQRIGSNYGTGNVCGLEYKGGGTLNALTEAMLTTTDAINAAGTAGFVEFWVQSQTLDGTDGWTFQLDTGSGYVTRLSELTGNSHAWQLYHYDLAANELVNTLKMRFQFSGGGASDDDRIDLDQISVTVTTGPATTDVTMYDDGAHGDGAVGDHVFGGQIPAMPSGTSVNYYVTATDNAGLVSTDPAAAPTDKYSYTVGAAALNIVVGDWLIPAGETAWTIPISVTGGAGIDGINFNVQIKDGSRSAGEAGPVLTALDILHGTIFDGQNTGSWDNTVTDWIAWDWTETSPGTTVYADGVIGYLTLNTVGCPSGTWDLLMSDTLNGPTDFAGLAATIQDGTIRVNQRPIADAGGPYAVAEGGTLTLDGSDSLDFDPADSLVAYQWDLDGDGLWGETGAAASRGDETAVRPNFSAAGLDGPGTWTVRLRVRDNNGLESAVHEVAIEITNVSPVIVLGGANAVDEGAAYTLTLGAVTDPGSDTVSQWTVHWGDGSSNTYASGGDKTHIYADDNPSGTPADPYTITVDLADEDGTHLAAASKPLTVCNVAPAVVIGGAPARSPKNIPIGLWSEVTDPAAAESFTYAWAVTRDGNPFASGTASTFSFTPPAAGSYQVTLTVTDDDGGADTDSRSITVTAGEIVGRHIFYNRSTFDGNDAGANAQDDLAIAPSPAVPGHGHPVGLDEPEKELGKRALLPGETATFVNYTSYLLGINGIMVDIANPANPGGLDAADFEFRVGNDQDPAAWQAAPAPVAIAVRPVDADGDGVADFQRVTIVWEDYTTYNPDLPGSWKYAVNPRGIGNQWLQVRVLATADTGLPGEDVFYFGNAIGETGNAYGTATPNTFVNATDAVGVRYHPHNFLNPAGANDPYDINRDGRVDASDAVSVRYNATSFLNALQLITAPEPAAGGANALRMAGEASGASAASVLTPVELAPVLQAAIERIEAVCRPKSAASLQEVTVEIVDLPGDSLGRATGGRRVHRPGVMAATLPLGTRRDWSDPLGWLADEIAADMPGQVEFADAVDAVFAAAAI